MKETRFPYDNRQHLSLISQLDISTKKTVIFGIQNDELFKLNFMPRGGIVWQETTEKKMDTV